MFAELIDHALILDSLAGTTKEEVLSEITATLVERGVVAAANGDMVLKRVQDREALGSTGIGNGVALPHVKSDQLEAFRMLVARSEVGVAWDAIDGRPVHAVFMLLAPVDRAEDHLEALKKLSTLARNADFRNFFMQASSSDVIRELLREMSTGG